MSTVEQYYQLVEHLSLNFTSEEKHFALRNLCRTDLFFLLWFVLNRRDMAHPWLLSRTTEVYENQNGYLDLWARGHYKSTIITFGLTILNILQTHGDDRIKINGIDECCFGFFSCTRPLAKDFLVQIKREFESNELLKELFPDILYENPQRDAPSWSVDNGLVVKRDSNPRTATLEAWGLVDGMPTGKHFFGRINDDVVTPTSVRSPDMIAKTMESLEMAINLGMENGIERTIGTIYHFNDPYTQILKRKILKPRIYPATKDGLADGEPVFVSKEYLEQKRIAMGPYIFATQMLLNPKKEEAEGFLQDWICYHTVSSFSNLNRYIIVDPANSKKQHADYTVMIVVGLGADNNYYILDMYRDRLNLVERGNLLFRLHREFRPLGVGYEKYGMQADIDYMNDRMNRDNYRFQITELGGSLAKNDRIKKLIPIFSNLRMYFPQGLLKKCYDGKVYDMVQQFIYDELLEFPFSQHDDAMDCLARITDLALNAIWPAQQSNKEMDAYYKKLNTRSGWAA